MKYRLVEVIMASGYVEWRIERKVLWWWEHQAGYFDQDKADKTFKALVSGVPWQKRKVIKTNETNK